MTLSPGDVIVSGTPGSVGAKRQPPFWLKEGNVVEVEIGHVGLLRNVCKREVGARVDSTIPGRSDPGAPADLATQRTQETNICTPLQ